MILARKYLLIRTCYKIEVMDLNLYAQQNKIKKKKQNRQTKQNWIRIVVCLWTLGLLASWWARGWEQQDLPMVVVGGHQSRVQHPRPVLPPQPGSMGSRGQPHTSGTSLKPGWDVGLWVSLAWWCPRPGRAGLWYHRAVTQAGIKQGILSWKQLPEAEASPGHRLPVTPHGQEACPHGSSGMGPSQAVCSKCTLSHHGWMPLRGSTFKALIPGKEMLVLT